MIRATPDPPRPGEPSATQAQPTVQLTLNPRERADLAHAQRVIVAVLAVALLLWGVAFATPRRGPARPGFVQTPPAIDTGYRVRINHDDADTLRLLPGVGPTLARNIVDHRRLHGPFTHPHQLEDVHRIGPSVRQRVTPWIRFD